MRFHFSCTRNPHTEREVYTMRTPRLRLLSALLAVVLFFTLLPVSALAEVGGSNANTGLTISIVGEFNNWDPSNITMKEVSPAVYEVTIENTSYDEINVLPGFKFIKDHTYADQWGSSVTASSGELHDAVYYGDNIMIDPGSDDESAVRNFIVRLDLTNWDWGTITGATFTITVTAPSRDFTFDATTGTIKKYNGNDAVVNIPSEINGTPVTTIGNAAFRDSSVTSVTIPASVTEIGANAFAGCTNLTSVTYGGDWSNLTIQSGNPAVEDAAKDAANEQLFDFEFILNNTAVVVISYKGTAADVTIPSRYKGKPVTVIDPVAFYNNSAVTSVTIPDSVTAIPDYAFGFCSQLTNISIPNSVTFIGFSAFNSCTSLKSITLPSSLSTIQSYAFYNCGNLKTIRIPVSVTSIGNCAFDVCPSLMTVTYPGSKTQWDDNITKGSNNDVLENHLICAKLEATFTADGTTFAQPQTIDRGGKFTKPAAPSKENHTFAGWYNGDEKFDFDADTTNAPNVLELVAKWDINQYTVQFVSDYGSFEEQTIEHGKPIGTGKPLRVQGSFVSDEEREEVVRFIKQNSEAQYSDDIIAQIEKSAAEADKKSGPAPEADKPAKSDYDELLPQAVDVILETKQASVSMLQRRLKLGYSRAARMVDQMEEMGIVGPFEGSKPRKILITKQQWQEMQYVQGTAPSEVLQAQTDFADDNEEEPEDDES